MAYLYEIYCAANDTTYIGRATNAKSRFSVHISTLKHGKHHNKHLQRTWDKYGAECFTFEIVAEVDESLIGVAEIQRIHQYINDGKKIFNKLLADVSTQSMYRESAGIKYVPKVREVIQKHIIPEAQYNMFWNKWTALGLHLKGVKLNDFIKQELSQN